MRVITESVRGITIHWPKEIVGVGEKLLPADCFGHPILSRRED